MLNQQQKSRKYIVSRCFDISLCSNMKELYLKFLFPPIFSCWKIFFVPLSHPTIH